ncbi:MAG TPA: hypothetical protein VHA12_01765 [Candidatus Nanoarchaeia archaeon]|nr:hypothetical protein [Candidatus Nanoarchaeia archaeon]
MTFRSKRQGLFDEIVPEGTQVYSRDSDAVRFVKKSAVYGAIGAGVILALTGLYRIDQRLEREDAAILEEHLHNAKVVIPQMEAEHNYRDAERLENEAWSYRKSALKGEFRAPIGKLDELARLLNSNNTIGAQ